MFSFTHYSLYYITELRYRIYYIFLNLSIISIYTFIYFNFFVVYFLKPLEYIHLDINHQMLLTYLSKYISNFFKNEIIYFYLNDSVIRPFDYFPIIEININTNTSVFIYLFIYI